MQTFRVGVFTLASLVVSFACSSPARSDIRPISPAQVLPRPPGSTVNPFGEGVAIDGGNIIVFASYDGVQQALLYRRNNSNGQWVYRRALVTWTGARVAFDVAMKNGIAAIQFGDEISLFEYSGGDYVRANSVAPIRRRGGLAISGNSVLIGGNNCDDDAVIYQKLASGSWDITGRIDDNQGQCFAAGESYDVELNNDYALLHAPNAGEATAWRRNGTSLDWVPAGTLALLPDEARNNEHWALQGATAVAPNGVVFRRSGTSTWIRQGVVTSVDHDDGDSISVAAVYRDGVLLTLEPTTWYPFPKVYLEASPGQFEHVANLPSDDGTNTIASDVSGRTVVSAAQDNSQHSRDEVRVFTLPSQLRAPTPLVNDFEEHDVSDFTFQGGQFALAARGSNDVLTQSATNGLAIAVLTDSDRPDDQRVEADITPTFGGTGSWVGLVARYVDANNYYYLAIRDDHTWAIYKRVNGVDTLLHAESFYNTPTPTFLARLTVIRNQVSVDFGFQQGRTVTDNSLTHGRGGLATSFARADFDNVHVAGTDFYVRLLYRDYTYPYSTDIGLHELSGDWDIHQECDSESCWVYGLDQRDTSGSAVAVIGVPIPNQEINARMALVAFAASQQGAWIGLLGRYVDANNHYYATIRSTGQIQIRKIVNGVVTVLGTANFTAVPGRNYDVRFQLIEDQLHLYVDGALLVAAHDRDIAKGQYGVATYRAAANWSSFEVMQP